jgi:hypothetical protein
MSLLVALCVNSLGCGNADAIRGKADIWRSIVPRHGYAENREAAMAAFAKRLAEGVKFATTQRWEESHE